MILKKTLLCLCCAVALWSCKGKTTAENKPLNDSIPQTVLAASSLKADEVLAKLSGVWLEEQYVEHIRTKKAIGKTPEVPELFVYNDHIEHGYNFHEGGGMIQPKKVESAGENLFMLDDYKLQVISTDKITLSGSAAGFTQPVTYVRIAPGPAPASGNEGTLLPIEKFISDQILTGQYKDQKGKSYSFTSDLTFVTPEKTYSFKPMIDGIFKKNTIYGEGVSYCYEWKEGKLWLYNARELEKPVDGDFTSCDQKPWVVLEKITN